MKFAFLVFAATLASVALPDMGFGQDLNPVPKVPKDDLAMKKAFAHAAEGLGFFLGKLSKPPLGALRFSVKIGMRDIQASPGYVIVRPGSEGFAEWFWVNTLRPEGEGFSGKIANDPEVLNHVAMGQIIHFAKDDIGDWMYFQNGKIVGNATTCPALAHASAEEQHEMKEKYGLSCD